MTDTLKIAIIAALDAWIRQRPGLEFGNYGEVSAYRAELRQITKDLQHARTLLRAVELSSITGDALAAAFKHAYSGRLSLNTHLIATNEGVGARYTLDYCTGQYWPTEYRKAAAAVCASALWDFHRDFCMPEPTFGESVPTRPLYHGINAGDFLRKSFKRQFGASIQKRWFD